MKVILFLIMLAIVFAVFYFLGWSYCNWIDGYKDAGVRMSFREFRRIYELAPSKWEGRGDYSYCRGEWISDDKGGSCRTYIFTSIAMKTLLTFGDFFIGKKKLLERKSEKKGSRLRKFPLKN